MAFDQVECNARIYRIYSSVKLIDTGINEMSLIQLRVELLNLKSEIDMFEAEIDNKFTAQNKRQSLHVSSKRYSNEIVEAISVCDKLLNS